MNRIAVGRRVCGVRRRSGCGRELRQGNARDPGRRRSGARHGSTASVARRVPTPGSRRGQPAWSARAAGDGGAPARPGVGGFRHGGRRQRGHHRHRRQSGCTPAAPCPPVGPTRVRGRFHRDLHSRVRAAVHSHQPVEDCDGEQFGAGQLCPARLRLGETHVYVACTIDDTAVRSVLPVGGPLSLVRTRADRLPRPRASFRLAATTEVGLAQIDNSLNADSRRPDVSRAWIGAIGMINAVGLEDTRSAGPLQYAFIKSVVAARAVGLAGRGMRRFELFVDALDTTREEGHAHALATVPTTRACSAGTSRSRRRQTGGAADVPARITARQ